jgi:hypothetical protein
MAFFRFYNSVAPNYSAAPPDNAPGGEMVKYEFETAASLGADTSGNARNLVLLGTPSSISTPGSVGGGALSVLWGGNSVGNATLGSAFTSLTSWRAEARFHNIVARSPQEVQYNQYSWMSTDSNTGANAVGVYLGADAQTIIFFQGGNFCNASIAGITDIYWRVQYNGSTVSYQVWNTVTGQAITSVNCGSVTGAMNLGGVMTLGGTSWNSQNYNGAMAFFRFYNSVAPNYSAAPPDNAPGGEMVKYEFETAANLGADTSGNARSLVLLGTPSSISTPAH